MEVILAGPVEVGIGSVPVVLAGGALRLGLVAGLGDDARQRVQHGPAPGPLGARYPSPPHRKLRV